MSEILGRAMPLSLGRRLVFDFLKVSEPIPLVVVEKPMDLRDLAHVRVQIAPRPSWCAILTKAYAKVVTAHCELRRAFLSFPWQRIYEYTRTTADLVVEAPLGNEFALVTVPLKNPDTKPLLEIDHYLRVCKENPVREVRKFRRALTVARFPAFLRRWIWSYHLNTSGKKRSRYFATFGVSSMGNWGIDSLGPIAPWTTTLHYGAIDENGKVAMRLTFDHRVLDGSIASRALNDLEVVLKKEMLEELQSLPNDLRKAG